MTSPLRIGILGAARIGPQAIVNPARILGHDVVAVAASNPDRAAAYATDHGIARSYGSYQELLDDPEVELVYNPLVNSLHREWNIRALRSGKHVLSEKPFTANAVEAQEVRAVAATAPGRMLVGFHYLHHPVARRIREIVYSGALGALRSVAIDMRMPAPPATDPRWSLELAGGATMDLGCYALHAMRHFGHWTGGGPTVRSAHAVLHSLDVDSSMHIELAFPDDLDGTVDLDMDADTTLMTWTVVGERGQVTAPSWPVPDRDARVLLTIDGQNRDEHFDGPDSYTFQLQAVAAAIRGGAGFVNDVDDAVANMVLIDAVYAAAGLPVRRA